MKKLRVLQFICPSGLYGAEMWILALARNFPPDSINCHLAVTRESDSQNVELVARYQDLDLPSYQLHMRGRFDPRVVISLSRLLRRQRFDVIHTHGYKSDILGLLAARIAGIKCVATPHGFENAPNRKLQLFIRMGCRALRHFDAVAPLSDELMADMHRIGVNPSKIKLIMNGVDLTEIESAGNAPVPNLSREDSEKKIGYVGQLAHRKNVADLLKTFELFTENGRSDTTRLILVGDGPQRPSLESLASTLRCSGRIDFLGYRKDRLTVMRELSLFSMTSSLEGIPRCMMEAMALGIPVAAYDIPGVDKLVINEETGLLAPFGDYRALERCWDRILSDRDFAARLAANAKRRVEERFSAKRMAEEYAGLYSALMA